uniref:Mitochondrial potassium channel ATP-binding subunit n=1 Tax=Ascaris lumbricoides TaxID=6252 RepID=A0A9J2PIB4_ASCLU
MVLRYCLTRRSIVGVAARCGVRRSATGILPECMKREIVTWLRRPLCYRTLLGTARLGGVSLSFAVPLLRLSHCQPLTNAELSRRTECLSQHLTETKEPELKLSDVWSLLKPYFGWFLAAVACAMLTAFLNVHLPILLGELVNEIAEFLVCESRGEVVDMRHLRPVGVKLLFTYAMQAVLTFLYISFLSVMGERMAFDLRMMLFERLLHQDMSFYDVTLTGELNARLSADVHEFKSCFKLAVAQGLRTFTQTGGCMVSLDIISPKMTLITMTAVPLVILVGTAFGALLRGLSRSSQSQSAIAAAVADEAFANIRTVRAFAMERQEIALFDRETQRARHLSELLGCGIGIFQGATNFFLNVTFTAFFILFSVVLAVLYGGASLISVQELNAGGLMSFLVTAQTMQRSLAQLSVVFGHALKGWTAAARVFEFANLVPSIPVKGGQRIPFHSLLGEIRFENVSFAYPSRPGQLVLEGLHLTVEPGKVLALCGPSGEGKTTLTALLERFYEPTLGRITLDGRDIKTLDPSWLRGAVIGLISQEPVLFATTIEENIRYGKPDATDQQVREAAQLANAHTFIEEFPDGYKTLVGERGVTLSGGQKQRVAIARALLKNPPVLIFDEATSALDAESENIVREALDRATRGRTVIIIAHRLSTIQNADTIAVLKDRKIVEQGTHTQLLKKGGEYYNLTRLQYQSG